MSKTIRIQVPDELYRTLCERAESNGVTPSEYLLTLAAAAAPDPPPAWRPTIEDLTKRIRARGRVDGLSAAEVVRELRGEIP